ncbi:hypothetical protein [Stieleria magnilauensis]|uniref:hypothetical protein n=1 Tax=Stieleria magnilauensis TaxID=2527963 RepID=UPI003AF5FFA1
MAFRTGLTWNVDDPVLDGIRGPWELLDLTSDHTEQTDLAAESPAEVNALATP